MNKNVKNLIVLAICCLIIISFFLIDIGDAEVYAKDNYSLVDVKGNEASRSMIYLAEKKTVTEVAKALSDEEEPNESSKPSDDKMFLVYDEMIVRIEKKGDEGSTVEIDTLEYLRENKAASTAMMQGYIIAEIIDDVFDAAEKKHNKSTKTYQNHDRKTSTPAATFEKKNSSTPAPDKEVPKDTAKKEAPKQTSPPSDHAPSTSNRTGVFTTKPSDSSKTAPAKTETKRDGSKRSDSSPNSNGSKSGSSSGSKSSSDSAPSTTNRTGTFTTK